VLKENKTDGRLAFLDDITIILDDVAILSKVAAKKTVAIVGDDLAVNANVVVGLEPSRELPIVGKIALGSLANKAVLIPLALALPAAVIEPLLLAGGAFLCYEAWHKVSHKKQESGLGPRFGKFLVAAMPKFMKALSILGTVECFPWEAESGSTEWARFIIGSRIFRVYSSYL